MPRIGYASAGHETHRANRSLGAVIGTSSRTIVRGPFRKISKKQQVWLSPAKLLGLTVIELGNNVKKKFSEFINLILFYAFDMIIFEGKILHNQQKGRLNDVKTDTNEL
ncbi:unnamed protein product [Protopolystoma xenopodis]|uniref:Uncharacterized protein n=1 Tax=Protopolystoma xenopodis TaxID=117903 RepID=A0A448WVT0_9PLAT|nr:unnamed protein product [Protopolystoma xenopodis]